MISGSATAPGRGVGLRFGLFLAIGIAVPLFAFPVARVWQRPVDAATLLAALFVLASLRALRRADLFARVFAIGAALAPLPALLPPHARPFESDAFLRSYAHWLLVTAFFLCARALASRERDWTVWAAAQLSMGALVALFALYQLVGIPRHWPATGHLLVPFQRAPMIFMKIGSGYVRPTSVFLEPAWLGGYLAWVAVAALCLRLTAARRTAVVVTALGLVALAVIATVSWGAYADLAAALGAVALVRRGRTPHRRVRALLLAAGLGIAVFAAAGPGRSMFDAIVDRGRLLVETPLSREALDPAARNSSTARVQNLLHTGEIFLRHPVRGIGFGQLPSYAPAEDPLRQFFIVAWCGWAAIGAQAGVPGALVLAGGIVLAARGLRGAASRALRPAALGLVVLAVVQQLHTASYIDLWWWYPLAAAAAMGSGSAAEGAGSAVSLTGSQTPQKRKE